MKNRKLNINLLHWYTKFKDKEFEQLYNEAKITSSLNHIRLIALLFGLIFFSMSIYDYFYIHNFNLWIIMSAPRGIVLLIGVFIFLFGGKPPYKKHILLLVSLLEIAAFASYLTILYMLQAQGFAEQCMAIMVLIMVIFIVPNDWPVLVIMAIAFGASFLLLAPTYIHEISSSDYFESAIYIVFTILISSIASNRTFFSQRTQFYEHYQLQIVSVTDNLTGAFNRMKFEYDLDEWCTRVKRHDISLSLIMFDLDDYKRVNDRFGHLVGDDVLVEAVRTIKENIRTDDILARWGGEEFTILLPNTSFEMASELAERLCRVLASVKHPVVGQVTASFGVTSFEKNDDSFSAIKRVDSYMYMAKKSGKNCVRGGVPDKES